MSKPDTKLIQMAVTKIQKKKIILLKELGFIQSYAHLVRIPFEHELDKKWEELTKAYPEKAQAIYD